MKKVKSVTRIIMWVLIAIALSWAVESGFIWLICKCFGWNFTFKVSTGVWLATWMANMVLNRGKK